jgi:hypothetical protein
MNHIFMNFIFLDTAKDIICNFIVYFLWAK